MPEHRTTGMQYRVIGYVHMYWETVYSIISDKISLKKGKSRLVWRWIISTTKLEAKYTEIMYPFVEHTYWNVIKEILSSNLEI